MARIKVQSRIAELMEQVIAEVVMPRKEWLMHLTRCARADVRKMFDSRGNPLPITELGPNEASAVIGLQVFEEFSGKEKDRVVLGVITRFKLLDKLRALELLGKACHYYADQQEQIGTDGGQAPQNITVQFVEAPLSPEEAYRRMIHDYQPGEQKIREDRRG